MLVRCLEMQQVDRIFCVPGESYLDVLDGLVDSSIQTIMARQEGGAAMMAEADAKLTGRPGIAMVTRGPGATNASSGVHVAQQDSTPMILFVGQIARYMRGRDAFQEVDYQKFFAGMAKEVMEIDQVDRIPETVSQAFHLAMVERPGPVIVVLPEDMLRESSDAQPGSRVEVEEPAPNKESMATLNELLKNAKRPFLILGGSRWNPQSVEQVKRFAQTWNLPVGCSFRRQMLFDHLHSNYAGDVGLGINPGLKRAIQQSDLILLLGGRLSEIASCGYTLLNIPFPEQTLVHVHVDSQEIGRVYIPTLGINASPDTFLSAAESLNPPTNLMDSRVDEFHQQYLDWTQPPEQVPGELNPAKIVRWLTAHNEDNAIMTNGAGNHTAWLHRFYYFKKYATQLAPTSGSMGYGLPAAIAAKLRYPDKTVICFTGDGCFQMSITELATAMQFNVAVIILLFDNGMHGTIRMHQEQRYPDRISSTQLKNPDFVALAQSYGAHAEVVRKTEEFESAFSRAKASNKTALIHLLMDPEAISPTTTLSKIRSSS